MPPWSFSYVDSRALFTAMLWLELSQEKSRGVHTSIAIVTKAAVHRIWARQEEKARRLSVRWSEQLD